MRPENRGVWLADRSVAFWDERVWYALFTNDAGYNISTLGLFYSDSSGGQNIVTSAYRPVVHISNPIDMTKPGQTVVLQPIASLSVGDVVYYDENGNGVIDAGASGNLEKYIVMYNNDDYGCQIISIDSKNLVIGAKVENSGNVTDEKITDAMRLAAQDAYNNIVLTLNTGATDYLNTTYGLFARAMGCPPVFGTADVQTAVKHHDTTNTTTITYPGAAVDVDSKFLVNVKVSDQGYERDKAIIKGVEFNKNIGGKGFYPDNTYVYASRQIDQTNGTKLTARGYNGVLWSYVSNKETVGVYKNWKFYPIITLRGNVTKGTGKGTVEEPYTLVIK